MSRANGTQTSYEAYDSVLLKVKRGVGLLASIIHVWICNQKVLPTCFNCPIKGISSMSPQWLLCHEQLICACKSWSITLAPAPETCFPRPLYWLII